LGFGTFPPAGDLVIHGKTQVKDHINGESTDNDTYFDALEALNDRLLQQLGQLTHL